MERVLAPALAAGLLVLATGSPASAATGSTVSSDGSSRIDFTAGAGQANYVHVAVQRPGAGGVTWTYTISDRYPITPGAGCSYPDAVDTMRVTCVLTESSDFYPGLFLDLGDRADQIDFAAADTSQQGFGGFANILGGAGNDVLTATGAEYLYGGPGNDTLSNGFLRGGDGDDTLYGARDGMGEQGDDLILGSTGADWLIGGPGNDRIDGDLGKDIVHGDAGRDLLRGNIGNDTLLGGSGDDTIYGNSGSDTIQGNSGNDRISGGPGSDRVSGGPGRDRIS